MTAQVSAERALVRLVERVRQLEASVRRGVNDMDCMTDPVVGQRELDALLAATRDAERLLRPETNEAALQEGLEALATVCKRHGLTPGEIVGRRRYREYVDARRDLARDLEGRGWRVQAIANLLDRDHASICNLLKQGNGASPGEG